MIPLIKFKQLLGEYGKELPEAEIEKIRQEMYILSDISFDFWEQDQGLKNGNKRKCGV